jgi:hypothetical protein
MATTKQLLGYQDSANQKQDFPVAAMFVIRPLKCEKFIEFHR